MASAGLMSQAVDQMPSNQWRNEGLQLQSLLHRHRQVRRDPHVLGWLSELRSHVPPLAKSTLCFRVVYLHRLLEELAWSKQIPTLTHLLSREDVPRRDQILPRALLPEQDQLLQKELRRRDDLLSNLLLLQLVATLHWHAHW